MSPIHVSPDEPVFPSAFSRQSSGERAAGERRIFDLQADELVPTVAAALSALIAPRNPRDDEAPIAPELAPFAGSIRFDGSDTERQTSELLDKLVHAGVHPSALIAAYCLVRRLVIRMRTADASQPEAAVPPTAAKALILTSAMLACKFNFDVGARMKDVKADDALLAELGESLVGKFGALEEHLLKLFDWQLRVSADEFADAHATFSRLVSPTALCPPSPIRMRSLPTSATPTGPSAPPSQLPTPPSLSRGPSMPPRSLSTSVLMAMAGEVGPLLT